MLISSLSLSDVFAYYTTGAEDVALIRLPIILFRKR